MDYLGAILDAMPPQSISILSQLLFSAHEGFEQVLLVLTSAEVSLLENGRVQGFACAGFAMATVRFGWLMLNLTFVPL